MTYQPQPPYADNTPKKTLSTNALMGIVAGGLVLTLILGMLVGWVSSGGDSGSSAEPSGDVTPQEDVTTEPSTNDEFEADPAGEKSYVKDRTNPEADVAYVSRMRDKLGLDSMSDEEIIAIGLDACKKLDANTGFVTVMTSVNGVSDEYNSTFLAGGAIQAYCPEHQEKIDAYMEGHDDSEQVPIIDYNQDIAYMIEATRQTEGLDDVSALSDADIDIITEGLCYAFHEEGSVNDGVNAYLEHTQYGEFEVVVLATITASYRCKQWYDEAVEYLNWLADQA